MVRLVRSGVSQREVARRYKVSVSTVSNWVKHSAGQRLDRVDFADSKPGRAWNRTPKRMEQRIISLRAKLRDHSILGEYGARAIQAALASAGDNQALPSVITIHRVLHRYGMLDTARRVRHSAPPKGWYLPAVLAGDADLDCFDFIEDLKIAEGPLVSVLTAKSLHAGSADAWVMPQRSADQAARCLLQRWQRDGLPHYAQFDNDTIFQGAHQFADTVGRISRLCLALDVIPVFVAPFEHGMQNMIEGFNALWQAKVWQRYRVASAQELQLRSDRYIEADRLRRRAQAEQAPARRRLPSGFKLDLQARLRGQMIYIRRTDPRGRVHLLGQTFHVSQDWLHRLVRCEVDFDRHVIHCFALRRRVPQEQPLLTEIPYWRPHKPFKGAP